MATVSPETKQVHFADSVDWEEEERRITARAEKKRTPPCFNDASQLI